MLVTEFKCKSRPQVPSECAIIDICVERTLSTVRPEAGVNLVENGDIVGDNPPRGSLEWNVCREPIAPRSAKFHLVTPSPSVAVPRNRCSTRNRWVTHNPSPQQRTVEQVRSESLRTHAGRGEGDFSPANHA